MGLDQDFVQRRDVVSVADGPQHVVPTNDLQQALGDLEELIGVVGGRKRADEGEVLGHGLAGGGGVARVVGGEKAFDSGQGGHGDSSGGLGPPGHGCARYVVAVSWRSADAAAEHILDGRWRAAP